MGEGGWEKQEIGYGSVYAGNVVVRGRTHDKKVDLPTSGSPRSRTVVSIGGGPRGGSFMIRFVCIYVYLYISHDRDFKQSVFE